jgi:hypothetical protein
LGLNTSFNLSGLHASNQKHLEKARHGISRGWKQLVADVKVKGQEERKSFGRPKIGREILPAKNGATHGKTRDREERIRDDLENPEKTT